MTKQELLAMEIHQLIEINKDVSVLRVLGGWVYSVRYQHGISSVFVSSRGDK